jgi:hypothetical protein
LNKPKYLLYRCDNCKSVVTRRQIMKAWRRAESNAVCACGGAKIRPTNLIAGEWRRPRVIWTWLLDVFIPTLRGQAIA